MADQSQEKLDQIIDLTPKEETETQEKKEGISCKLDDFQPKICRPEKTAVIFLGSEAENTDEILGILDELQDASGMDFGVLDMADVSCADLATKYKIDREASQIVVFQNCEKVSAIALEGDIKEQVARLKKSLEGEAAITKAPQGGEP